jgi:hypothetical protein
MLTAWLLLEALSSYKIVYSGFGKARKMAVTV